MTPSDLFPALPDDARCWVHTAAEPLSDDTQETLLDRLQSFIDGWTSHGRSVRGRATVLDDRFLVLAATIEAGDISGCGIDSAVHAIDEAAADLQIDWAPSLHVVYRRPDGEIEVLPRPAFRRRVNEGTVTADTSVFDPSVSTLGAVRHGDFEQPAGSSWHARTFQIPEAA
mgnify:CR=1 FL=1